MLIAPYSLDTDLRMLLYDVNEAKIQLPEFQRSWTSAFIPMFTIMWVKEIALLLVDIYNNKAMWPDLINPYLIGEITIIVILIISFAMLMYNNKKLSTKKVKVISVKNRTGEYYLG